MPTVFCCKRLIVAKSNKKNNRAKHFTLQDVRRHNEKTSFVL